MAQRWKLYNIGRGAEVALTTPYYLPPPDIRSMSPNAHLSLKAFYPIVGQNEWAFRGQWLRDVIYFSFVGCGSGFAHSKT